MPGSYDYNIVAQLALTLARRTESFSPAEADTVAQSINEHKNIPNQLQYKWQ